MAQRKQPMFKHPSECELFKDCCWLYSLLSLFSVDENEDVSLTSHIFNVIYKIMKHEILDSNRNWSQLAFLEAYYIKACVCYFYQIFIFFPNDSSSKIMKNAFYFI